MKFKHPFLPYSKLILNCCPTGNVPNKQTIPHVPISADEIIRESLELAQKGVSVLHLHARDASGQPTWSKDVYERIFCSIREKNPEVILCASTSGRFWSDFDKRSAVLELSGNAKPDMASLALGSMNFKKHTSINHPQIIRDLAKKMKDNGIKPELEVFDFGMMEMIKVLGKEGLLEGRSYINIILGNIGTAPADLGVLSMLVDQAEADSVIAVSGLGRSALPVHVTALAAGLHVRFGLEDSIYLDFDNKLLATNFAILDRLLGLNQMLNRSLMTPKETRHLLEI